MSMPPPGYYVEVRDPRTQKLVCRVNPHTGEVVTVGRSGDIRRGTLPPLTLPPAPVRPPVVPAPPAPIDTDSEIGYNSERQ